MKVHPHMLRHTGVTQMLYRYMKNNGLMTGLSYTNQMLVADAHIILQQHLGHVLVDTTRRYVRTIERVIQETQLDILLNSALSISRKHQKVLDKNPLLARGMSILEEAIKGADSRLDFKTKRSLIIFLARRARLLISVRCSRCSLAMSSPISSTSQSERLAMALSGLARSWLAK